MLFLEQFIGAPADPIRDWRWWSAYPGSSVTLPCVMVDSGNQISNGPVDYTSVYREMVEKSLARKPRALIRGTSRWEDGHVHFDLEVTNLTGTVLSSSNAPFVHALVYEAEATDVAAGTAGVTGTYVRAGISTGLPALADRETAHVSLDTPEVTGIENPDHVHSLVILDYLPGGDSEAYDTLQAAFESPLPPPSPAVLQLLLTQ